MDLKKYNNLRNKKNRDFEGKYKRLDKFLYLFSWAGNAGSIFFAYFLVFPAFFKAITANLDNGDFATYLAGFLTVIVLGVFEMVKREVLSNLSFDLVSHKFNVTQKFVGWLIFSIALIAASFYFSLNGAINFADTSKKKNVVIENTIDAEIDSLTLLYTEYKKPYVEDNASLREANVGLRDKIDETGLYSITAREKLQGNIDKNKDAINDNDQKINELDAELDEKIAELKSNLDKTINENASEDVENIIVFLVISTSIEFIIILGVFFREFYDYTLYLNNASELEDIMIKRDRYNTLLKFIYKQGSVTQGEKIIGISKLKEVIKDKSRIPSPNKFVDDFIADVTYMGILKLEGNRRYTAVSFEDALKKIEEFDDTLRLLENLK